MCISMKCAIHITQRGMKRRNERRKRKKIEAEAANSKREIYMLGTGTHIVESIRFGREWRDTESV